MLADDICQDSDDDTGVVLEVGDWIVKEANEIEVIANEIFKRTYKPVKALPQMILDGYKIETKS